MNKIEKVYEFDIELLHYLMENKELLDFAKLTTNDMQLILSYCEILEDRIDKAIEYIEDECNQFYTNEPHYRGYQIINIEPLLEILKGDKNA